MLQTIQQFLLPDDDQLKFFAWFFSISALLYGADALWRHFRKDVPRPAPRARARGSDSVVISVFRRFGQGIVTTVAHLPVTPNQITVVGLVLVAINCIAFYYIRDLFCFGSGLVAAVLFDTLDGQVARVQGSSSRFGAYLDAVVDRYQEAIIFLTIAIVLDQWLPAFLILTGSLVTSYNKARLALEMEIGNKGWPDLLEKPMRLTILCIGLMASPVLPWIQPLSIWMLAILTNFTALQRFARAYFRIVDDEAAPRVATGAAP